MPQPRTGPSDGRDLSRRDFLTKRLPGRVTGLLGGGATAAPSPTAAEAARSDPAGSFAPGELTRMGRDQVTAAIARIRARRRGR
jgi:hypothetical protein